MRYIFTNEVDMTFESNLNPLSSSFSVERIMEQTVTPSIESTIAIANSDIALAPRSSLVEYTAGGLLFVWLGFSFLVTVKEVVTRFSNWREEQN